MITLKLHKILRGYIYFLLFVTVSNIQAQNIANNSSYYFVPGTYNDENGGLISGDFDPDYTNKNSLFVTTGNTERALNNFNKYQPEKRDGYLKVYVAGVFYDLTGKKVKGFFKYNLDKDFVLFKADKNSEERKITTDSCTGFVVGPDSFPVIKRVKNGNDIRKENVKYKKEFALFYDRINDVTIYLTNRTLIGSFTGGTFYIKPDTTDYAIYFPNLLSENELFQSLFETHNKKSNPVFLNSLDRTEVVDLIGLLRFDNKFRKNQKVFLDTSWNYVVDSSKALYYAKVTAIKDSIVSLRFFNMKDLPVMEGSFIYEINGKKDGTFSYYDAVGGLRKQIIYTDNQPDSTILFYPNGLVHFAYTMKRKRPYYYNVRNEKNEVEMTSEGVGIHHFFDAGKNRSLNYKFNDHRLIEAFYIDSIGRKIYQYCGKDNAEFMYRIQSLVDREYKYPKKALAKNHSGYMLIKCMVEPDGMVSDFELIRGIDSDCDSTFSKFFSLVKEYKHFSPGRIEGEKVRQEVVVPVCFIAGFLSNRNFYKSDPPETYTYNPQYYPPPVFPPNK